MRPLLALLLTLLCQEVPESLRLSDSEFTRRRTELAERFPDGAYAVDAGPLGEVGSDANTPVFDFKYLTGFHDPEGILVVSGKKTAVFVSEDRKVAGIDTVLRVDQFEAWAAEHLLKQVRIFTKLRAKNLASLTAAVGNVELVGSKLGPELTRLRLIKVEAELRLMRK